MKMNFGIAFLFCIQLLVVIVESYIASPVRISSLRSDAKFGVTCLSAYSSPGGSTHNMHSSSAWGSRRSSTGVPSRTACESAVNVEWEPMSELDRRIEDGVHYEHMPHHHDSQNQHQKESRLPGCHSKAKRIVDSGDDDDSNRVRAVFCAYRYSAEDYNRLKSADIR
jgi:hypothetical protein